MPARWQAKALTPALAALAYAVAFAQRPGWALTDTKIDLHTSPGRFLASVASTWGSSGDLGHVQGGQSTGYLFPMGPFYAVGHSLGLATWVVQRLWLGTLLALCAWGTVRLLDALYDRRRSVAHLVGGAVAAFNPFVVVYSNRTSVTLLASAALPWLLLCVHRGLREPGGWRWPTAFAVLVTASGGGVNGAVTFFMLVAPVLLAIYEPLRGEVSWRDARRLAARAVPATLLISMWWLVPAYIQSGYGPDFLRFTEQPGTIWATTSASESLRLMGFWDTYLGYGFAGRAIPAFSDARTLLFSVPVVLAGFLVPALSLGAFAWTRRWRYAPFFLGLALLGLVVMIAGFPQGTPLRHGLTFTYNHLASVRVLRTTYKAGAVVSLAIACLAAAGADAAWRGRGRVPRAGFAIAAAGLVALSAWPLVSGRAEERQLSFRHIPAAWRAAANAVDHMPANTRAAVLPGDLFAFYAWGGTSDPILPALTGRPVAERALSPYADPRAADLLWTSDGLIQQQRLLPGQLGPLLRLMSVSRVVTGTDDDDARSDAIDPWSGARALAGQGLGAPAARFGPVRQVMPPAGVVGAPRALPEVRVAPVGGARGLIRIEPASNGPTVVDGSAAGLAGLAAFGALPGPTGAIRYAGDMTAAEIRAAAAAGGRIVITDSNRRQAFVPSTLQQNTGAVLAATENLPVDGVMLDPFNRGPAAQTVAALAGAAYVRAPLSPEFPQFPEHRPMAAFDGSPDTAWLADPHLDPGRWWLEVGFATPRRVPYVDLLPYGDADATLTAVEIAGRRFTVHPGWNHLVLGGGSRQALRVALAGVRRPPGGPPAAPGIAELRVPGLHLTESLRPPVLAADALAGQDLRRADLSYVFARTTGPDPLERTAAHGPWSDSSTGSAGDAERQIDRTFRLPAPRRFTATAWVQVAPDAPDARLDRLAGYRGPLRASSAGRYEGRPAWRASSAFDGDPATAWVGTLAPRVPTWLELDSPRPLTARHLRLLAARGPFGRPTRVRIGAATLPVAGDGSITLAHPIRSRALRIEILAAAGAPVVAGLQPVAVAEVEGLRGAAPIRPAAGGAGIHSSCSAITVRAGGRTIGLRVNTARAAFSAGAALPAWGCGVLAPAAGTVRLSVSSETFAVNDLRLDSPPAGGPRTEPPAAGAVLSPGHAGRGRYDGVRVAVREPAWLVLGESYNRGWRAWCDGRDLGAPVALDGYANAWRVGPGCRSVRFAFGPNSQALAGYAVSALALLACLALIARERRRGRGRRRSGAEAAGRPLDRVAPHRPIRPAAPPYAALAGLGAGLVTGFLFGLAAGGLAVPAVALVLWRGIGSRGLSLAAGALLVVVAPLLHLLAGGNSSAGDQSGYPAAHMGAHWATVAGLVALALAFWREVRATPRGRSTPYPPAP